MILAWVMSLLLLCSSLIVYLERFTGLLIIEVKTIEYAHNQFMEAEKSILECEENITHLSALTEHHCFIQSAGKGLWLISSKQKPSIQTHVFVDEKLGTVTRFNWRQAFE